MASLENIEKAITEQTKIAKELTKVLEEKIVSEVKYVYNTGEAIFGESLSVPQEQYVAVEAAKKLNAGAEVWAENKDLGFPCIVHISDIHGDEVSFNTCVNFANSINAHAIVHTGDCAFKLGRGKNIDFVVNKILKQGNSIPFINTIGNHDQQELTLNEAYEIYIKPFVGYGYKDVSTSSYYYYDNKVYKLRFIVLNEYQHSPNLNSDDTLQNLGYEIDQIEFLIRALATTPKGYGIFICNHFTWINVGKDQNSTFSQNAMQGYTYNRYNPAIKIPELIDTFISRGSGVFSFPYNVVATADFSDVDPSIEFLGFLCGHGHRDEIGYIQGLTNKVLSLTVTTAHYQDLMYHSFSGVHDLPRTENTYTHYAFNVYVIDRIKKKIRIVRIGSNISSSMMERKIMSLSYV